ncbi:MAG: DUF2177 family protein [Rhodobiaceae bacterium]|nr:DUF2177 family protein [Rhodobiaceae bacterium]
MMRLIGVYAVTAIVFLGLDFVWLSRVAKTFYASQLGGLLLETPRLGIAGAFYALYVVGIVVFAILPAQRDGSFVTAAMLGALLGLVAYATYDITNYATLKGWPATVVAVDIAWCIFVTAASALAGYAAARLILAG